MEYRPTAVELLAGVADELESSVLPATTASVQHTVRISINIARILSRELELSPKGQQKEKRLIEGLLGHEGELSELRTELTDCVRDGTSQEFMDQCWDTLVQICADDLSIAKPGYANWGGE